MDTEEVATGMEHFRGVTKMMTDRDLLEMEFSRQEIDDLREIFSQNCTKSANLDKISGENG